MKLGLFLLAGRFPGMTEGEALAGAVDAAVVAEQAGLESVWIAEHHFITYGVCPSAVALAANILGQTSRITVGTGVCMLSTVTRWHWPRRPPPRPDLPGPVRTRGRAGRPMGRPGGVRDRPGPVRGRLRRVARRAPRWTRTGTGRLRRGRFFRFRPVPLVPRPATRPRPPVVVAATTAATAEAAATRGLPLLLGLHADDDETCELLAGYAKVAADHGYDPDAVEHLAAAVCHLADSRARSRSRPAGRRCRRGSATAWAATPRSPGHRGRPVIRRLRRTAPRDQPGRHSGTVRQPSPPQRRTHRHPPCAAHGRRHGRPEGRTGIPSGGWAPRSFPRWAMTPAERRLSDAACIPRMGTGCLPSGKWRCTVRHWPTNHPRRRAGEELAGPRAAGRRRDRGHSCSVPSSSGPSTVRRRRPGPRCSCRSRCRPCPSWCSASS